MTKLQNDSSLNLDKNGEDRNSSSIDFSNDFDLLSYSVSKPLDDEEIKPHGVDAFAKEHVTVSTQNDKSIEESLLYASKTALPTDEDLEEISSIDESDKAKRSRYAMKMQQDSNVASDSFNAEISESMNKASDSWRKTIEKEAPYIPSEDSVPQQHGTQHLHRPSGASNKNILNEVSSFDVDDSPSPAIKKVVTEDGQVLYKKRKRRLRSGGSVIAAKRAGSEKRLKRRTIFFKRLPKPLMVILIILLVVALMFASILLLNRCGELDMLNHGTEQRIIEYNGKQYMYNEKMTSILFVGYDARTNQDAEVVQSDLVTSVALDTDTGNASVIALPRDAMVDVTQAPDYNGAGTKYQQLCTAFSYGNSRVSNAENTKAVVQQTLLNVPIQSYFALNMQGVGDINDSIGGVTLTPLETIPGTSIVEGQEITLNGEQALAYVRHRAEDATGSDKRLDRQVQYMRAFVNSAAKVVKKDPGKIIELFQNASKYATTDIGLAKAVYLANILANKGINDISMHKIGYDISTDGTYAQYYLNEDSIKQNVIDVYYLPFNINDMYLKENSKKK